MFKVAFYKKLLSYLFPIRIKKSSSTHNDVLELFIYRGQFQLGTEDALYSDGKRYKPMKMAFKYLKGELDSYKKILFLGGGLCSGIQILEGKAIKANSTIVEIDDTILNYSKELFKERGNTAIDYISADAQEYMRTADKQYDLIVIDIFNGRVPAEFVTDESFLMQCRNALTSNGSLVLNYIVNGYPLWEDALEQFSTVFPSNTVLKYDINRVIIATV